MSSYSPFRFYRLCPEDSHTCVDRECLSDGLTTCPKRKVVEATRADGVKPSLPADDYYDWGDFG